MTASAKDWVIVAGRPEVSMTAARPATVEVFRTVLREGRRNLVVNIRFAFSLP
ncbi:hypothetical protein D3C71_1995650 [compost metagenome]